MKNNNVKCFSKTYVNNFYHFVVQQLHGLYQYSINNNYDTLNFYYDGPYVEIIKKIPFLNHFPLSLEPKDCLGVKPISTLHRDKQRKSSLLTYSNYLKELFLPQIKKTENKHVLIIQRAHNRIIENEEELLNNLKLFGELNVVILDNFSFISQIELIHNSKIIVAPHGAGLTHMLFASEGTQFIEIYSKGFHGIYPYKDMASKLGLKWDHVEAEYSSMEVFSKEDIDFIKKYKTDKNGRIQANVLLSKKHQKLRKLIRDQKYIKCPIKEIIDKINKFNVQ
jgi:hypothetical protein